MTQTQDTWVTVESAANRLGVSVRTVWRMAARGEVPTRVRLGSRRTEFGIEEIDTCPTCGCFCRGRRIRKAGTVGPG